MYALMLNIGAGKSIMSPLLDELQGETENTVNYHVNNNSYNKQTFAVSYTENVRF